MQLYDERTASYRIDPTRVDLAREFRRCVRGPHSDELRRVLHRMRSGSLEGKHVLVCLEPRKKWMLAQLQGPGRPVRRHANRVFTSLEDAEWEVFKLRWKDLTGRDLDLD